MSLQLINLRKVAIQKELEIIFKEKSSSRSWKIARDGVIKFAFPKPWGDPLDYTPEQVLDTADEFDITIEGREQILGRKEMEDFVADALKSPQAAKTADEDRE